MSCSEHIIDKAADPDRCKCQGAVLRTYEGLVSKGQPIQIALEAAKIVYGYHHPEDSKCDAALTVERWIHAGNMN